MSESNYLKPSVGAPVGLLKAALNVLAQHGYDTEAILSKCHITSDQLADVSNRVTTEQYYTFNRYLLEHTDLAGLGLLQGSAEKITDYGLIGNAVLSSDNLNMARQIVDKYRLLFGPICEYHSELHDDHVAIVCQGIKAPLPTQWCVEGALAALASSIRQCLPEQATFLAVRLSYPAPDYANLYEEVFGCPAYFSQERNELCYPRSLLEIPFASANAVLRELCLRECDKVLEGLKANNQLIEQVEAIIRSSTGAVPQFPLVAETLKMSPRTLHRRLTEEGTTYRKIVENLRKRLAKEYLTEAQLGQKEVAYLLGYAEPANFYHAFQRWFNCTPSEFLQSQKDTGGPY